MLAFLSTLMVGRKKSTMAQVHILPAFVQVYTSVSSKQCVHAWYPLFVCPERLLRAGQSLMVTNSNAFRLNSSCPCSSHIRTPFPFHSCKSSSTNGLRYKSMSLPGCLGPWMRTGIITNFRFMHIQGGRLYIHRVTGQVL